jgi:hypothetical protein
MNRYLHIACLGVLISLITSCTATTTTAVADASNGNSNVEAPAATPRPESGETPPAPPRTPLPAHIRKDADGNLINPEGWSIQEIIAKKTKRRTETGKTKSGKTVIFNVLLITPEGRPVSEAATPAEDYYEWRISDVRELSDRNGKVFCYEYGASLFGRNSNANGFATATSYSLCDYDGDGKYEFNGSRFYKFTVPEWVRSLPGDPNAIDNNANW